MPYNSINSTKADWFISLILYLILAVKSPLSTINFGTDDSEGGEGTVINYKKVLMHVRKPTSYTWNNKNYYGKNLSEEFNFYYVGGNFSRPN